MAAVATPSEDLLTKKAGPLPVWGWSLAVLGVAYAYSRYKASKSTAATSTTSAATSSAAEPSTGASPYYVIENNLPQSSTPISVNVPGTTTTPTGTAPQPPTNNPAPVPVGVIPPHTAPIPAPVPGHAPTPVAAPPKTTTPQAQRYTVQKGDTLWGIAQKFTGNGSNYAQIWTYNLNAAVRKAAGLPAVQGSNPNLIYPGEVFLIPPKS